MSDDATTREAAIPKQATADAATLAASPPDYFGSIPNYANSPLPVLVGGVVQPGTGIRKFIDTLPGLGPTKANNLGNYLPVATPDTITYPGSDYYEIGIQQYTQQVSRDLPATRLRGYKQLNNGTDPSGHNTIAPPARPYYLGPVIVAQRNRPVRVKLVNQLPTGAAGNLFLPVDITIGGAGTGPLSPTELYTQNRAVMHLHGSETPWISDGTPLQWFTPAGEVTSYPQGASYANVPTTVMPDPGPGAVTLYFPMQQSARMMWFHDHTEGITHLTPYSGQIGLLLLRDPVEQQLVTSGVIPAEEIPLVIQDKTFVPDPAQLAAEDPTWDTANWGGKGSLWMPHVYMPNQNPYNAAGANPMGRWDYGPWVWPPFTGIQNGPVPNPYYGPTRPLEPPVQPGTPLPTITPEAFLDTPVVNGCAYPTLQVEPKAYRFRILNACNDRTLNLQLYYAASNGTMWNPNGTLADGNAGEVPMVEACPDQGLPPTWPTDGRAGGVPDPNAMGPDWIQIGNEGGLLPGVAVIPPQPINYEYDRRSITVLNVSDHSLLMGPAERADVIVDFSSVPSGSNIILYNDGPAPIPGFDTRYDYYTGDPDQTASGGAPTTQPGYGPNTRTIMQFRVVGTAQSFHLDQLMARLPQAYGQSQPPPIVPEKAYDEAFGTNTPKNTYVAIEDTEITFTPFGGTTPVTLPLQPKAIVEDFDQTYGRMNALLGTELPKTSAFIQTTIPLPYINPPTEILTMSNPATLVGSAGDGTQIWKVTHNGVDTHAIHFHYFNVQLINRVGWDGTYRPPNANELGWKETVRMNPLEDCIVAMRPTIPNPLPFKVGDSVRLLDPTQVPGTTNGFAQIDPTTGDPATVTNQPYNFGWEYVWHCHLVDHEDNDMMRPMVIQVSPGAPTNLTATANSGSTTVPPSIVLAWTNPTGLPAATQVVLQRATNSTFTAGLTTFTLGASANTYTDSTVVPGVTYYYRVRRENTVAYSAWSNVASAVANLLAPTNLVATQPTGTPIRVSLSWTNRSYNTSVELQRATNSTFTAGLTTVTLAANTSSYTDSTVVGGTTYYRVRTVYLGVGSPYSNTASVAVTGIPAVPTNLTGTAVAVSGGTATVNLTWQESTTSPVTGFTLQRATNVTFTSGLTSFNLAGTARAYSDTGRARSTTYYYRIQAVNSIGASAFSSIIAVTTPA
ncbi:hypothetical protein K7640_14980 [Micromonospora sp. PLK6-60]|uniref:hypothetical protein n=1 Tax=Micromonospora sp. PLK6-60 TaxID=2873383 RepID=UPI001CA6E08B|nr:hypothetical protein [Micromonospora sp. PLK6-60]MBY8873137.1 hypothetical protein [Micromonospora sp. PLK6-60]